MIEHFITDRVGARCACGVMPGKAHFVSGESTVFCEACCPFENRKPAEPSEPMQPIGGIAGKQEDLF